MYIMYACVCWAGEVCKCLMHQFILHSKCRHGVLQRAVWMDSCKWICHFKRCPHITRPPRSTGWACISSVKHTSNNTPNNFIFSVKVWEMCSGRPSKQRGGIVWRSAALYSSGTEKELGVIKSGRTNIGTTSQTKLIKHEESRRISMWSNSFSVRIKAAVWSNKNFRQALNLCHIYILKKRCFKGSAMP